MTTEGTKDFQPNAKSKNWRIEAEGIYEQLKDESDVSSLGFEKLSQLMRKQLLDLDQCVSAPRLLKHL